MICSKYRSGLYPSPLGSIRPSDHSGLHDGAMMPRLQASDHLVNSAEQQHRNTVTPALE